jgi:hypothetical protein
MSDAGQDALILDSLDRFLERAVKPDARARSGGCLAGGDRRRDAGARPGLGLGATTSAKWVERVSAVGV